jgi:hypothetical protein
VRHQADLMWSTIQYDPNIKAMYERLVAAGKLKKVAPAAWYAKAANYPEYNDEERYSLGGKTCLKSWLGSMVTCQYLVKPCTAANTIN